MTRRRPVVRLWSAGSLVLVLAAAARGEGPGPNSPDEPLASQFSAERGAAFLDRVAVDWTRERKCGTCHTNYALLVGRPMRGGESDAAKEVRRFFEDRVENWDGPGEGDPPRWDAEVVATAAALAIHDARRGTTLHPMTRKALDRMGLPFLSAGRVEKGLQPPGHLADLLDRPTDRL